MKFITEEVLRDLFKVQPFTDYVLEPGEKVTPGARQFLMDKGINISDFDSCPIEKKETGGPTAELLIKKNDLKNKKLICSMKSVEALFFLSEQELLSRDVCLAQNLISLGKQFSCIKNAIRNKTSVDNLCCQECTGINKENFSEDLEDCIEISEFHIQLERGREIIILHRLRCVLQEMIPVLQELYENENGQCEDMVGKVNQIVNRLSQLICSAYGGKKCLRQN